MTLSLPGKQGVSCVSWAGSCSLLLAVWIAWASLVKVGLG